MRILVLDDDLYESPEVQALKEKGHPVDWLNQQPDCDPIASYDLILGRRAWYLDKRHLKYLEKVAIPSARTRINYREKEAKTK